MADQVVQLPVDGSGKKVDVSELTVGANTVERQRINVADPTAAGNIQNVKAASTAAVATDMPAVVALHPSSPTPALADTALVGTITAANANLASGTATAGSAVASGVLNGISTLSLQITGTLAGSTLLVQVSNDNANWITIGQIQNINTSALTASITALGAYVADVAGFQYARVTCSVFGSGSGTVTGRFSAAPGLVGVDAPLPSGTNTIGLFNPDGTATGNISAASGFGVLSGLSPTVTSAPAANSSVQYAISNMATVNVNIAGTWAGTIVFDLSMDGVSYTLGVGYQEYTSTSYSSTTANQILRFTTGGWKYLRVRFSAYTSGTANLTFIGSQAPSQVVVVGSLPTGNATLGKVFDLKDRARLAVAYWMTAPYVNTNTDTMVNLVGTRNTGAIASASSFAVSNTWRPNQLIITVTATSTTLGFSQVTLRYAGSGTVTNASQILARWIVGLPAATCAIGTSFSLAISLLDFELTNGFTFGFSVVGLSAAFVATAIMNTHLAMTGYEY